ncbi:MAG: hypothetical protein Q4A62_05965 [Eikenella sp.]|nr:hypothetical protein [Eikenella sp.]
MDQYRINEEFSVVVFGNKAFVTLSLVFLLLIALVFTAAWYWGVTGIHPAKAFAACVVLIWAMLSSKIYSRKLHFLPSSLIVKDIHSDKLISEIKIESHNSYFFVLKKIGWIIRIYDGSRNHFFFITSRSFLNWEDVEEKTLDRLNGFLKNHYPLKNTLIDQFIFFFDIYTLSATHRFPHLCHSKNGIFY